MFRIEFNLNQQSLKCYMNERFLIRAVSLAGGYFDQTFPVNATLNLQIVVSV